MITPKLTPAQRKTIDEYAEVRASAAAWRPAVNPHAARLAELQKHVMDLADLQPADAEVLLVGRRFSVPVGMRRIKRTIINLQQLWNRLGKEWMLKHCAPSLGDLDKALEPEDRAHFIDEERTLSRIIGEPVQAIAAAAAPRLRKAA